MQILSQVQRLLIGAYADSKSDGLVSFRKASDFPVCGTSNSSYSFFIILLKILLLLLLGKLFSVEKLVYFH